MFPFVLLFRKLRKKLEGAFYGAIASTFIVVIYGTISEFYIENPFNASGIHSLFESLWWVVQTITTVGYGDVPIVSFWGKVNGMFIMLVGIGSLGILTASIGANLVEMNVAAKLGERRIRMKEHVIICNSVEGLTELIEEINNNGMGVVLVDSEDPKLHKVNYSFVKGKCSVERDLDLAGISKSSKIVVLPEKGINDPSSADAKSILTSMVIRKARGDAYIVAELLKEENRDHALLVRVNEVVVRGSMSTLLLANAITSPGVSKLMYELLRGENGNRIREYPLESKFRGKKCKEVYDELEREGSAVLAFKSENDLKIRPSGDTTMSWDAVIVIEPNKT